MEKYVHSINLKTQTSPYARKIMNIKFTEIFIVTLLLTAIVTLLQYHWKRRRMYKLAAKIPGPTSFPIIGSAHLFAGSTLEILNSVNKLMNNYKSPVKVWLGHRLFFGISKPEHLEIIFNSPHAQAKDDLYKFAKLFAGEGIFTAPVPKWKKNRKLISPTFNQKVLNTFCEVFAKQATICVECLKKVRGKEFNILPFVERYTLDIVCETSMGVKVNAQNSNCEVGHWIERLLIIAFQRMFQIWYHPDFIFNNLPIGKEFKILNQKFQDFTDAVIKNKKEAYKNKKKLQEEYPEALIEDAKEIKTFLELIIELSEEGNQMTDIELRDEVNTFIIAGSDTTASTLGFTLVMIAMHSQVQQKIYEEVMDILGPEKQMEFSDLPKFKYTERVLMESMRLFPIGPLVVRSNDGDIQMGEHLLPAGSSSVLFIFDTHRNSKYWSNPLKFDPDRFLPEEIAKRHPYTYLPFTGGPRICIGKKYGIMMAKTVIAHIVRSFVLSTPYKTVTDVEVRQDLILKTVHGHKIRLDNRT